MYGLSIDNLVEVEMVLADGRIVIVNAENDPGKYLFHHQDGEEYDLPVG